MIDYQLKHFDVLLFRVIHQRRFDAKGDLHDNFEATLKLKIGSNDFYSALDGTNTLDSIKNATTSLISVEHEFVKDVEIVDDLSIHDRFDGLWLSKVVVRSKIVEPDFGLYGKGKFKSIAWESSLAGAFFLALDNLIENYLQLKGKKSVSVVELFEVSEKQKKEIVDMISEIISKIENGEINRGTNSENVQVRGELLLAKEAIELPNPAWKFVWETIIKFRDGAIGAIAKRVVDYLFRS